MKKVSAFLILTILVSGILVSFLLLSVLPFFELSDVKVYGQRSLKVEEVKQHFENLKGKNIFKIDTYLLEEKIMQNNKIDRVNITRGFPDFLYIEISEKEPFCAISEKNGYGLSFTCELIPLSDSFWMDSLPVVTGLGIPDNKLYKKIKSLKVNKLIQLYQDFQECSPELLPLIRKINFKDPDSPEVFINETRVLLGCQDWKDKLEKLNQVWKNETNFTNPISIDLRYENLAIVDFQNQT